MSRSYWRSLAQVAPRQAQGDPDYRAALEREFPEGASELPEGVTRREMMTLVGASLALAGLTACRRPAEAIVPYVNAPEEIVPGVPRYYATTMPFRRSAYGLIVESHEGRPTKIEGNPAHPSTLGASSTLVQASVLGLYDPDRSQSVALHGTRKSWSDFVAAWGEMAKAHGADGGAGLAVVSESFSSPTLARLASELRLRFPRLQWATYDAVSDENRLAGLRSATGRDLDLMLRLDRASVILALDADPLLTDPEMIRHASGFAAGRRAGTAHSTSSGQAMNRLYAVEGVYSLTGAIADHRLRLESRQIAPFLAALAARLAPPAEAGAAPPPPLARRSNELRRDLAVAAYPAEDAAKAGRGRPEAGVNLPGGLDPRWIDALARDLLANRGKGLIVAGERQPPAVHAAVCALNTYLGNTGKTVSYYETKDAALPSVASLASLAAALKAGTIKTLVILGGNPAFDAPADLDFASAMAKAPQSIALAHTVDETSVKATWHIPRAHYLESWGDARAVGGTLSVVQPLILPLFGGKSPVEMLALMVGDQDRAGYDIVRGTWAPILGDAEFEKKWNRVLHDGLLSGSELQEVVPDLVGQPLAELASRVHAEGAAAKPAEASAKAGPPRDLEVVFLPSPSLHDGRFANNGWLQELPDPLTKLTWDNPALVSPKTAESLGVVNEDLVRLDDGGRSLDVPVWVLPGMADGVVALTLGYGRSHAGRIGSGVGFNTFTLRSSRAAGFDSGVKLTRLGRTYPLSSTQHHGSMEGRPIVRELTLSELQSRAAREGEVPGKGGVYEENPQHFSLWKEHAYDQGHQWGMTIDLNTCIGCNACMVACQSENNVPVVGKVQVGKGREMHWLRVDRYFTGEPSGAPEMVFQPVPCMQCEAAPCEQVCPVAATVHDAQGLNVMVYNRCIGTRYCSNNCPYKVRRFNFFNFTKDTPDIVKLAMNPDVTVRARGVMEKCTYCLQRINRARIDARLGGRALRDGDVRTACQQACPVSAIEFGDIRDRSSRVMKAKADSRNYALLEELNTKPRTTYLAKVRNPNPDLKDVPV